MKAERRNRSGPLNYWFRGRMAFNVDQVDKGHPGSETTQVIQCDVPVVARPAARDRGSLLMLSGPEPGKMFPLDPKREAVLGRGGEASLRIDDRGLSRNHARLFRLHRRFWIEDLRSTNGTFVNGVQVFEPVALQDGDRIQIGGDTVLCFQLQDAAEQEASRKLYDSAVKDPLTQVHNRRYLDERLEQEFAFAVRHQQPLSALMVDVDHFKSINDTFGHAAGDAVLRVMAQTVRRTVRTEDLVARYGGEEFCVLARGVPVDGALVFGERLRATLEELSIPWEGRSLQITSSIGCATWSKTRSFDNASALLQAADAALYRAKDAGRNMVIHVDVPY